MSNWAKLQNLFPENLYTGEGGILLQGDCLDIMKRMPDGCVDLVVTDPPYNIGDSSKIAFSEGKPYSNKELWGSFEPTDTDRWMQFLLEYFEECYRICSGSIVVFYDRFEITKIKDMLQSIGYYPKNIIGFVKKNPAPHLRKTGFRSDYELAVFCQKNKGKDTFNFLTQKEMTSLDHVCINGEKVSKHPTEKPLSVIKKYIRIMSNPSDVVLDGFAGSGTTLVAAKQLGRKFIGVEIEPKYIEICQQRLAQEVLKL